MTIRGVAREKVEIIKRDLKSITFSYTYSKYAKPNTFAKEKVIIKNNYTLNEGEKIEIDSVETYWAYAKGGENGLATLVVEWISYDDMIKECLLAVKNDEYDSIKIAQLLIQEEIYDLAFEILSNIKWESYELGLCYEKGYGTINNTRKIHSYD